MAQPTLLLGSHLDSVMAMFEALITRAATLAVLKAEIPLVVSDWRGVIWFGMNCICLQHLMIMFLENPTT